MKGGHKMITVALYSMLMFPKYRRETKIPALYRAAS